MGDTIRVFSFGGGWQSVAVAILQVQGKIAPYDVYLHANVGDDSENPDTVRYINQVFAPWAAANNIRFEITSKSGLTLYDYTLSDNRTIPIPVRMSNGAPGNRTCTQQWKTEPIHRWIRQGGYTHAVIGLGFSADEMERVKPAYTDWHTHEVKRDGSQGKRLRFNRKHEYPLIDLRLFRSDLEAIFASAGLPTPPKSACWFCPFKNKTAWITMRQQNPDLFQKSVEMERRINEKRHALGKDDVYLHSSSRPLDIAVGHQPPLFDFETGGGCDSGTCFT